MKYLTTCLVCGRSWVRTRSGYRICHYYLVLLFFAALSSKSIDYLTRNRDNVSEWGVMSACCLTVDSVSQLFKDSVKTCRSSIKWTSLSSFHRMQLVLAMIQLKNCSFDIKQQSLTHSKWSHDPRDKLFKEDIPDTCSF